MTTVKLLQNTESTTGFTGTFTPSGLTIGGQITSITLDAGSWTALQRSPTTSPAGAGPLADRNAISIQNVSGTDIKIQYDNGTAGYVGILVANGNERHYAITDSIVIYAKAAAGTPTIVIEELA